MAKKIVLAGACRTAIGSMGGALSTTPAPELGSIVIKEALNRAGVAPEQVDHVLSLIHISFTNKYDLVLLMDYQEDVASVYEVVDIKTE